MEVIMKKKVLAMVLGVAMVMATLTGCGTDKAAAAEPVVVTAEIGRAHV